MSAEIINLRQYRKRKERAAKEAVAAESRARAGRSKAERKQVEFVLDSERRRLEAHSLGGVEAVASDEGSLVRVKHDGSQTRLGQSVPASHSRSISASERQEDDK